MGVSNLCRVLNIVVPQDCSFYSLLGVSIPYARPVSLSSFVNKLMLYLSTPFWEFPVKQGLAEVRGNTVCALSTPFWEFLLRDLLGGRSGKDYPFLLPFGSFV